MKNLAKSFRTLDMERLIRVSNRFLVTVGGISLFAWLPTQAPLFIGISFVGLVAVFSLLYALDINTRKEIKHAEAERDELDYVIEGSANVADNA